jgi:hypothetical protein
MKKTNSDNIVLDQNGRVILTDPELEAMAAESSLPRAGGSNTVCSGSNAACANSWCGGTTNGGSCMNGIYCAGSSNTHCKATNKLCIC